MLRKDERTVALYKEVGAEMRLFKDIGSKLAVDISKILPAAEADKFLWGVEKLTVNQASHAEDRMYSDHPELSTAHNDVFYGNLSDVPRNDVDREVIRLARQKADELFGGNV